MLLTLTDTLLWLMPLAVALDLVFGDPQDFPLMHPVRRIGALLDILEPHARRWGDNFAGSAFCLLLTSSVTGYVVWLLCSQLPGLWVIFSVYFAWAGLSLGELLRAGEDTLKTLEKGSLPEAQTAAGKLVSRDTSVQDRESLYKTLAETLAENVTDAVVAPLFWLALTGPVGLWVYKAVSTMDSMWGYKTPRWIRLGQACARADDVLAFLPARFAAFFLYLAALLDKSAPGRLGLQEWNALMREGGQMESPNSGRPMAVAAWLHGAGMGGPTLYFGEVKNKPLIGPQGAPWDSARIRLLLRQIRLAGLLAAGAFYGTASLVRLAFHML